MEKSRELVKYEQTMEQFNKRVALAKKRASAFDIPVDIIACVLEDNNCDLDATARELKCTLSSLIKVSEQSKQIRELMVTRRMKLVNLAEDNLEQDLLARDQKATFFTLKTLGKKDGYFEKTDQHNPINPNKDPSTMINAKVDLANLSGDQLGQLSELLKTAGAPSVTIDNDGSSNDS